MKAVSLIVIAFVGLAGIAARAQVPVIDKPEPAGTFQSPFNGQRQRDGEEGKAYARLQQLHDLWRDDLRAEGAAGDYRSPEFARLHALVTQSNAAFQAALDQYVEDWSTFRYPKGFRPVVVPDGYSSKDPATRRFYEDRAIVMASLLVHEKSVVVPPPAKPQKP